MPAAVGAQCNITPMPLRAPSLLSLPSTDRYWHWCRPTRCIADGAACFHCQEDGHCSNSETCWGNSSVLHFHALTMADCLCVVCCEPIYTFCLGQCDHRSLCMPCGLRLRTFFDDNRCPMCKVRVGGVVSR